MTKQEQIDKLNARIEDAQQAISARNLIIKMYAPQVLIYPSDPQPETVQFGEYPSIQLAKPPTFQSFLDKNMHSLIYDRPGFLFHLIMPYLQYGTGESFFIGYTYDHSRLVFVPQSMFEAYKEECLKALDYNGEPDFVEMLLEDYPDADDEEINAAEEASSHPSPKLRAGTWKARQVSHWIGEKETTPEVDYPVWPNGTFG